MVFLGGRVTSCEEKTPPFMTSVAINAPPGAMSDNIISRDDLKTVQKFSSLMSVDVITKIVDSHDRAYYR